MNWFKHFTSDRNELAAKVIKKRFGPAGYGIYVSLLEVIGENVKADNVGDWGHVDSMHTIETLADECACTVAELQEFLNFCNEKLIFEKNDGKLYCALILERLDEYATKLKKKTRRKRVGTKSGQNRDTSPTQSGSNRVDVGVVSGIEEEEKRREIEEDEKKPSSSTIAYLRNIPQADKDDILERFELTEKQLLSKAEDLANYCKYKGKQYKDYKAFLVNALKKDFKLRQPRVSISMPDESLEPIDPKKMDEIRKKAYQAVGRSITHA